MAEFEHSVGEHRQSAARGRPLKRRENQDNPRHPFCKPHLRRTCGTCAHFPGTFAPQGEPSRAGTCGAFGHGVSCRLCAWECPRWTRKGGGS